MIILYLLAYLLGIITGIIGLLIVVMLFKLRDYAEQYDGEIRGCTKEAQKHKRMVDEINREFRKLEKI